MRPVDLVRGVPGTPSHPPLAAGGYRGGGRLDASDAGGGRFVAVRGQRAWS